MESTRKKVGKRLRDLRKKAGYKSYENFAFDNDLTRQTIERAEHGENITLDTLFKILKILKISPEEFFKGIK